MHIVLWDTRKLDVSKDFAAGFGVGQYPGYGGLRGKFIRRRFTRDWPGGPALRLPGRHFRRLGHTVECARPHRLPQPTCMSSAPR